MSKKLLLLLLCITLGASLILSSCGKKCNAHTDSNGDGICDVCEESLPQANLFNLMKFDYPSLTTATSLTTYDLVGTVSKYNSEIIYTTNDAKKAVYAEDGSETTLNVVEHRIYDVSTGTELICLTSAPGATNDDEIAASIEVTLNNSYDNIFDLYVPEDYILVSGIQTDGNSFVKLYSLGGTLLKEFKDIDSFEFDDNDYILSFHGENHFVMNKILYRIEDDGSIKALVNVEEKNLKEKYGNYRFRYLADKYYATYSAYSYTIITVFDNEFNFVKYTELPALANSGTPELFFLNNGNAIATYTSRVELSKVTETSKYDYSDNTYFYKIDTYLINTSSGEICPIDDIPLHDYSIKSLSELNESMDGYAEYSSLATNVINGYELINGTYSYGTKTYILNNDGTLGREIVGIDDVKYFAHLNVSRIVPGYTLIQLPYGDFIYTEDGRKIGELPAEADEIEFTKNWIVHDKAVYNYSLEKVYEFGEEYEIIGTSNEAVYACIHNTPDSESDNNVVTSTYFVYNGELKELFELPDYRTTVIPSPMGLYVQCFEEKSEGIEYVTTLYSTSGENLIELKYTNDYATHYTTLDEMYNKKSGEWIIIETLTAVSEDGTTVTAKYHLLK